MLAPNETIARILPRGLNMFFNCEVCFRFFWGQEITFRKKKRRKQPAFKISDSATCCEPTLCFLLCHLLLIHPTNPFTNLNLSSNPSSKLIHFSKSKAPKMAWPASWYATNFFFFSLITAFWKKPRHQAQKKTSTNSILLYPLNRHGFSWTVEARFNHSDLD